MREITKPVPGDIKSMLSDLTHWNAGSPQALEAASETPAVASPVVVVPAKTYKTVLVTWVDSSSRPGWTPPSEARSWSGTALIIRSIGFLYHEGPDAVILAQSFDSNADPHPNGLLQIPRCAIIKPIETFLSS
jgi:hypothetical protein